MDWSRLDHPQDDGYDSRMILSLTPRRSCESSSGQHLLFDGRVVVRAVDGALRGERYRPAEPSHPNIKAVETLIKAWPTMFEQCATLLVEVRPFVDTSIPASRWRHILGSSSDSTNMPFGVIAATVDNVYGFAQAVVHELAHHKLRALGVHIMSADRLIKNDPSERYPSPIVRDRLRPMTAVVHAQYSFMHVVALDIALFERAATEDERRASLALLARNTPRMEFGHDVLAAGLRTDRDGERFFEAFSRWSVRTLETANTILFAHGFGRGRPDGTVFA